MHTGVQFNELKRKPLVLIAPLDWGLGHTTRCIPLISYLLSLNCFLLIACNEAQKKVLQAEFPAGRFVNLSGYNVHYASTAIGTYFWMLWQIPRVFRNIRREHKWLQMLIRTEKPDLIISDNRYGLYHPDIPSILITHQLNIKSGVGKLTDSIIRKLHFKLINRFHSCWVPDELGSPNCAGELSHPPAYPFTPIRYIGCLSRLKSCTEIVEKDFILIILSGPEPQRSLLEEIILSEANERNEKFIVIRGLQKEKAILNNPAHIKLIDFANVTDLNRMICEAKFVIARSGYTAIMDLLRLQKRCVLIPTPGQTEQLYLAKHVMKNHFAWTVSQKEFTLQKAIDAVLHFEYKVPRFDMERYKRVIDEFILKHIGTVDT